MPGPLYAPTVLFCYPFRFRDPITGKWVRARYNAERHELEAHYREWEIIGEPELQWPQEVDVQPVAYRAVELDWGIPEKPPSNQTQDGREGEWESERAKRKVRGKRQQRERDEHRKH